MGELTAGNEKDSRYGGTRVQSVHLSKVHGTILQGRDPGFAQAGALLVPAAQHDGADGRLAGPGAHFIVFLQPDDQGASGENTGSESGRGLAVWNR